tara:strand:- start:24000 stop:24563 length:564 start_codon:yes stop_codon:yes gene_type:complete
MLGEQARLHELAEDLGLDATIECDGHAIELSFKSPDDRELYRSQAWSPGLKTHTITFDDPDFVPIWVAEVGPVMKAARSVDYELYVIGDRVRFSTQNPDTYAMFMEFEKQGMFNGPHGGREHWEPIPRDAVRSAFRELMASRGETDRSIGSPATITGDLRHLEELADRIHERRVHSGHQIGQTRDLT